MGFVSAVKGIINIILVILGIILNWWALCSAIGIVANKLLHNRELAELAWKISLMPDVVANTEKLVRS